MATIKKPEVRIYNFDLPDSTEIERRVLADAVVAPELIDDYILPIVDRDFFTSEERAKIWDVIIDFRTKGQEVNLATIHSSIGTPFTTEVAPYMMEAGMSDTPFHAKKLRDLAAVRRSRYALADFLDLTSAPATTEEDVITALQTLQSNTEGPSPLRGERKLSEVFEVVNAEIKATATAMQEGKTIRVTTGFIFIDKFLNGGFKAGQLVILAARPSVGKTALMLQMAKGAAKQDNPVQVFSLEMQAEELAERLIYSAGKVRPYQVNFGEVDDKELQEVEIQLAPLPLYINDFSRSLDEIVSRLTMAVKKGRCKVAFIDYLGLMSDALNFGNAKLYQVIARITGTFKAVAKRLRIPIVLLCQLNREQAREGRSPELFDLRDSGSIEQDADVVLMLESNFKTKDDTLVPLVAWLRKNRAGKKEVGFCLEPNETYSAFYEMNPILPPQATMPATEEKHEPEPQAQPAPVKFYNEPEERNGLDDLPF